MPRTRKGTNASPSRSPPRPSAAGESPRSRGPDLSEDGDAAVARFSALVDRMQAAEDDQPPAADDDRDEVMSEASAKTAVTAVEAADPNATLLQSMKDMEAIECAVLEFAFLPTNRVPTEARTFFATKIVESYAVCSRVTCEASRQSALASLLRRQLAEARREAAELRERLAVAEARLGGLVVSVDGLERGGRGPAVLAGGVSAPSAAGGSAGSPAGRMDYAAALRTGLAPSAGAARGGPGAVAAAAAAAGRPGALHKHVAFLTPVSTTATPARDVLRLLKSKVDPRAQNIRDVTLHHTRWSRRQRTSQRAADGEGTKRCPRSWWRLVRLRETSVCESRRVCARSREIARSIMAVGCFSRPAPESSGRAAFPTARASTDGH
ncbi:uncharacterized protein [Dermacentor albipictus]|uniref:uncharacterized protein isoform X3 n=1 Tax=Dermacentor albipictus TaxID=60249 RepID=UPI0031FD8BE5